MPTHALTLFLVVLFRYIIIASVAFSIFYWVRKEAMKFKKIQLQFPTPTDYYREIFFSLVTALIFTGIGWLVFMTPLRTHTLMYLHLSDYGLAYFVFSIFLILIVHDTYFYWTHRAMHHPAVFKLFHRVHHLSTNPSPWAAMAFHPLEAVVEAGIIVVVVFLFPVHPLAIGIFLVIMMLYNVYGHLGYELYPKGFATSGIGKWINTSVNHNQHHQYFKGNYGLYFLWWDKWMGTLRSDYPSQFEEVKARTNSAA
jgi:lathosterol oxidase